MEEWGTDHKTGRLYCLCGRKMLLPPSLLFEEPRCPKCEPKEALHLALRLMGWDGEEIGK